MRLRVNQPVAGSQPFCTDAAVDELLALTA
jgi:hypothetical protein